MVQYKAHWWKVIVAVCGETWKAGVMEVGIKKDKAKEDNKSYEKKEIREC